mgnify:CR=1 FL=1
MHPIFSDKKNFLLFNALWILSGALLLPLFEISTINSLGAVLLVVIPMMVLFGYMSLASWYVCKTLPIRNENLPRIIVVHCFSAGISSSIWLLISTGAVSLLAAMEQYQLFAVRFNEQKFLLFGIGALLFLLAVAVHYLIILFQETREKEQNALRLQLLAQEAELKALRAQINPHFLFNSLNSISALTTQHPQNARTMCVLLSDFLRTSLKFGAQETISIEEELALIKNFLAIEQIRFGERLHTNLQIDPQTLQCAILPLLLQPLVENAINHGIAHVVEGGTISLSIEQRGEKLYIAITNPCDADRPQKISLGIGVNNVRQRLFAKYGTEARVDVSETSDLFRVDVMFPCIKKL